jgi:hypothetical protein
MQHIYYVFVCDVFVCDVCASTYNTRIVYWYLLCIMYVQVHATQMLCIIVLL